MRHKNTQIVSLFLLLLLIVGLTTSTVYADETTDEAVLGVIAQLEGIDTLQQMQDKRSSYSVASKYNVHTTSTSIINAHETKRAAYETYLEQMFSAREAAQQAYDALTDAQKAQIAPELVAKLDNELDTVFTPYPATVTPRDDEYVFQTVYGTRGLCYEASNVVTGGSEIPCLFILVDSSNGETFWTPSGEYVYGESNYELAYCCDIDTQLNYDKYYKRVNLEDSTYFGEDAAQHIRAILQNAYPFITLEEMKSDLKAKGMNAAFVDQLTRGDVIAAVQMSIWAYANAGIDGAADNAVYGATYDVKNHETLYQCPMHDYTNELWTWWTTSKRAQSYDVRTEYRVNTLVYYLCHLDGVAPDKDQIVVSDAEVTRADLVPGEDGLYRLAMYVYFNHGGTENDDLKVTVTSYHTDEDGTVSVTAQNSKAVNGRDKMKIAVNAMSGDTIQVVVEGTQYVERGVYFYEPEFERGHSQSLVGVAEGSTRVRSEKTFEFVRSIDEMGLQIHKVTATGSPISNITFTLYRADPEVGETPNEKPTEGELERYMSEECVVGSAVTDVTGYAEFSLDEGRYLVVEEPNPGKVKEPVEPFYITLPMTETVESEDGTTTTETVNIVSIYPKNELVKFFAKAPAIPAAPSNVIGSFEIFKYDKSDSGIALAGAQFQVYRPATEEDENTEIIYCDGLQYEVVPVLIDEEPLLLTTDENGSAVSPSLVCGTYYLVEVTAPNGYYLADEAFSVTVNPSVMEFPTIVEIANQREDILPNTGGMGTTYVLVIGSLIVCAAAVLIIKRKTAW